MSISFLKASLEHLCNPSHTSLAKVVPSSCACVCASNSSSHWSVQPSWCCYCCLFIRSGYFAVVADGCFVVVAASQILCHLRHLRIPAHVVVAECVMACPLGDTLSRCLRMLCRHADPNGCFAAIVLSLLGGCFATTVSPPWLIALC